MNKRSLWRPLVLLAGTALSFAVGGAVAFGEWTLPSTPTKLSGQAGEMPDGPTPIASRVPDGVKVTWAAVALSGSANATYDVTRHQSRGTGQVVCSVAEASCVDTGTKAGDSYTYTVRVVRGGWKGRYGRPSDAITIDVIAVANPQTVGESAAAATADARPIPSQTATAQPRPTTTPTPTSPGSVTTPPDLGVTTTTSPPATTDKDPAPTSAGS